MQSNYYLLAYFIYLPIVVLLTWYVAHTLFQNSKVFMIDIFRGRENIALSTNKLFEVGFYLLNLGAALCLTRISATLINGQDVFEILSTKIGGYTIYLGLMLFINLYLFFRGKRISHSKNIDAASNSAIINS